MGLAALVMTACEKKEKNEPDTPTQDTIPASFPKKHLIEEFTGQDCGYCPQGMTNIHSFIGNESNWVLVLHHYGYQKDNFSVAGSKTITSALGVQGAPNMSIDRKVTKYAQYSSLVFSPYGPLSYVDKSQFETETYASVNIENSYNASTRELYIKVSGALCKEDYPDLKLTVLVKESGMIDYQADYYGSWQGWTEFRHTNAVRAFATDAKGDPITVNADRRYEEIFSIDIKENWVPENCMVVAILSEDFKPVVQVEEAPVISGTKGGADIMFGGITAVPVPDYFPEPGSSVGPFDFTGHKAETFPETYGYYEHLAESGVTMWTVVAQNSSATTTINNIACYPYMQLYLYTPYTGETVIPNGIYPLNTTYQAGTAEAGVRDEEQHSIYGSMLYFVYPVQGGLNWLIRWLIADGELVITDQGWTLTGHARNGSEINLEGTTPIQVSGPMSTPRKQLKHEEK